MYTMKNMIGEVEALKGANVRIFGQPVTLPEDTDNTTVDIIDILKNLEETDDMMNEPTSTDEETVQFTYRVSDNEFTVKEISLETYNKIMELLK